MKFFGRRKLCPDWDGVDYVATPVGVACSHCDELIVGGDDGWFIPYLGGPEDPPEHVYHHACHLRGILGSVAHQQRRCSCYVAGSTCGDDPALTRRQAAEASLAYFQRH